MEPDQKSRLRNTAVATMHPKKHNDNDVLPVEHVAHPDDGLHHCVQVHHDRDLPHRYCWAHPLPQSGPPQAKFLSYAKKNYSRTKKTKFQTSFSE